MQPKTSCCDLLVGSGKRREGYWVEEDVTGSLPGSRSVELTGANNQANVDLLDVLHLEWGVDRPGRALGDFSSMSSDDFVSEVRKRRHKGTPRFSSAALKELRALFDSEAPQVRERRLSILKLESEIADSVHAAWGLDAADLALMRQTEPPRMPPGW